MKVLSNRIHSLWMAILVALLAMLSVPFSRDALGMPVSSIAYDGQVQPSIAYDGPLLTAFDYDSVPVPVADENGNQITGRIRTVGAIVDFAEFLAEKTASLAAPGARVPIGGVQATEIAGRLTPAQMVALQAQHGTEFAQVYLTGAGRAGGGGSYYLIQGAADSVQIPIGANVRLISHTHPELLQGGVVPLRASGADYNVLRLLQQSGSPQRTSQIVPEVGTPFNFRR